MTNDDVKISADEERAMQAARLSEVTEKMKALGQKRRGEIVFGNQDSSRDSSGNSDCDRIGW